MFRKLWIYLFIFAAYYPVANAAPLDCGSSLIEGIHVTSDIAGDPTANKLFILLKEVSRSDACVSNNIMYGYIDNTATTYDGVMALSSMAYAVGVNLRLIVDDTAVIDNVNLGDLAVPAKAYRIEGIGFN